MSFSNLLDALQSNFAEDSAWLQDVSTVRGLLAYCKQWPGGRLEARDLEQPCREMAARLRQEAAATERDLANNRRLCPELRSPMARIARAFRAIGELLETLPETAATGDLEVYQDALAHFEQERQAILDAQAELEHRSSSTVPRCPGCGRDGAPRECSECGVLKLVPDPGAARRSRGKRARLGEPYYPAYRAYVAVANGRAPFDRLLRALLPVESHLRQLLHSERQLRERGAKENLGGVAPVTVAALQSMLTFLAPEIKKALEGLERIRAAEQSQLMRDINGGWDEIFEAARVIERGLRRVRADHGYAPQAQLPEEYDEVLLEAS